MRQSIATIFGPLLLAALASGCVTAKKYDDLAADLDKAREDLNSTRDELVGAQTEAKDLRLALEESQMDLASYESKIADLEDELGLAERRASESETELAQVIKDRSKASESIEEMQMALAELKRQRAKAELRAAVYRSVLSKFQSMIDSGKLEAKIVDGRMVLHLPADILFPSGSARLSEDGATTIHEVGRLLAEIPNREFQVEGHTDNVPINTKTYPSNWQLAAARAIVVTEAMIEAGMPRDRVSAASYADTHPAATNQTPEGRAQNRRIEVVLMPELSDLPGIEQLEAALDAATTAP